MLAVILLLLHYYEIKKRHKRPLKEDANENEQKQEQNEREEPQHVKGDEGETEEK